MITCKEDLHNTYIINDHGELRDLFLEKCKELGLVWLSGNDPFGSKLGLCSAKIGVTSGIICTDAIGRLLTDADLKPQTKEVEWVNGDECLYMNSSEVHKFIGVDPTRNDFCYIKADCSAVNWVEISKLSKPETEAERKEREEIEAASYLLSDWFNAIGKDMPEWSSVNEDVKAHYLRIVRKTNYKVKGE
ncbi:coil containing protein [Vibrio phage 1.137.O._10N.261.46.B5]|nr:hypothetical protein NVP1127O_06 [Vibrio phage 1.127.O._10N.286.52.E12]AUR90060.1 coil containing protein [Vibrio phage 1.137.O._10N.261.46.B5]